MKFKWTIVIAVWLALGLSIYFSNRHEWLDYAWLLMFALFVVATVVNFGAAIYRKNTQPGNTALCARGYPRWFMRFALDQTDKPTQNKVGKAKHQRRAD
jgi:hypothetical protein